MAKLHLWHLFGSAVIAAGALVGLNVVIAHGSAKLPAQQLLARIDRTVGDVRFIFLGDSQMEADVDPVAFSAACAKRDDSRASINVGLGATKASEHCLVLEHLLPRAPAADTLFYGFYDNVLTEPVPSEFRELGGNRALAFLFPARAAELIFPADSTKRSVFRATAKVPMIAERLAIWAKVERGRRRLATLGLPPVVESRFGRAADFGAIEPADPVAFETTVGTTVREQRPFNFATQELLRIAAERQLKLHLLVMPVPSAHRARYYSSAAWQAYRGHVGQLVQSSGGELIDAADWLADEDFEDQLHAAPTGARIFSTRLAQEICRSAPTQP